MGKLRSKFVPGCALILYKPELSKKIHDFLNQSMGNMELHMTCCKNEPQFEEKTHLINVCPGCDKRFENDYPQTETTSLWEILAESDDFDFPDYKGKTMTILDACPSRNKAKIHEAIRTLLKKMNITLVEAKKSKEKSVCCGDSFYGSIPVSEVKKQMIKRSNEMPVEDVIVYCVSCIKSMFIGGKKPHYLVDLLFKEESTQGTVEPDLWHKELDDYIAKH